MLLYLSWNTEGEFLRKCIWYLHWHQTWHKASMPHVLNIFRTESSISVYYSHKAIVWPQESFVSDGLHLFMCFLRLAHDSSFCLHRTPPYTLVHHIFMFNIMLSYLMFPCRYLPNLSFFTHLYVFSNPYAVILLWNTDEEFLRNLIWHLKSHQTCSNVSTLHFIKVFNRIRLTF